MRVTPSIALQTALASIDQAKAAPRPDAAEVRGVSASNPTRDALNTATRAPAESRATSRPETTQFVREVPRTAELPRDYRPGRFINLSV